MSKPRLLIPLTIQFAVRYVIRTGMLKALQQISEPILLLGWNDPDLYNELKSDGYQVSYLPCVQMTGNLVRLRTKIKYAHLQRVKSSTTNIDRRRHRLSLAPSARIQNRLRTKAYELLGIWPGNFERWLQAEQKQIFEGPNCLEFVSLVEKVKPDYLFSVTPYLLEDELLIRAAAQKKVKLITAILSFDNLTTRPRIPVLFDKYLLWNEFNRQELLRIYPDVNPNNIELVGSPQFDFYYDPSYLWDEFTWRERLRIPLDRPVILFGAGPPTIAPMEPHNVAQLDDAIEQGQFPNNPIILLRLHPVDTPARWESLRQSAKHVIFDLPWQLGEGFVGKTNVSRFDIEKLASTLKYSQVHINTSSTMTLDGAIFDRPQIGPAYDNHPGKKYDQAMRDLYLREHYIPITNSGGLQIAYSFGQLREYIIDAFRSPERYSEGRKKMIRALCTYDDGKSTQRVARAIEKFLNENRPN